MSCFDDDRNLLVELRTEDLPPLLDDLSSAFKANLLKELQDAGLAPCCDLQADCFGSCRRITAFIRNVLPIKEKGEEKIIRGPDYERAYDHDKEEHCTIATKALHGFLAKWKADFKDLMEVVHKGKRYVAIKQTPDAVRLEDVLGGLIENAVSKIVAPRKMRWTESPVEFVRPIRGAYVLHGSRVLKIDMFGFTSSDHTKGHHVLAPDRVRLGRADDRLYLDTMRAYKVNVGSFDSIGHKLLREISVDVRITDYDLFKKAFNSVEWPVPIEFLSDAAYDSLPDMVKEVCVNKHMNSFAIGDKVLENRYVYIADGVLKPGGVRKGLEKVLRYRLDDAMFIYKQDMENGLPYCREQMSRITHTKISNMDDWLWRISKVARHCAGMMGLGDPSKRVLKSAALHLKLDTATQLYNEYPSLEGKITALMMDDALPETDLVRHHMDRDLDDKEGNHLRDCLILALETECVVHKAMLDGLPTGTKDPRGFRRHFTRIIKILKRRSNFDFMSLLEEAYSRCGSHAVCNAGMSKSFNEDVREKLLREVKDYAFERAANRARFENVWNIDAKKKADIKRRWMSDRGFDFQQIIQELKSPAYDSPDKSKIKTP